MLEQPITVLILSWNRPIFLWACLDSLYRYTKRSARFVLVDNNSDDKLVKPVIDGFARRGLFHSIEYAETNSPFRGYEMMYKHRHLFGDYFIFIESDCVVFDTEPCWLSRFCNLMDANPEMALLGSYVDTRDFIDPDFARRSAPDIDQRELDGLIKAHSPERELAPGPCEQIIDPFNPPGRLLAIRTSILDRIQLGPDDVLYNRVKATGMDAGIATSIRHRHLSLLNFFDYPGYGAVQREKFVAAAYHWHYSGTSQVDLQPMKITDADPLIASTYVAALSDHLNSVSPVLTELDNQLKKVVHIDPDALSVKRLRTMRSIVRSGLFDDQFYLATYDDVRATGSSPLEHFVQYGDGDGRQPNPFFVPEYYRKMAMCGLPEDYNSLEHYIDHGECDGKSPSDLFNPEEYLDINPLLAKFVNRPLFHFLKIGQFAQLETRHQSNGGASVSDVSPQMEDFRASGQRALGALMRIKQVLTARLDVDAAFAAYKSSISLPDSDTIRLRRVMALQQAAETFGSYFRIQPGGEAFGILPPKLIGAGVRRTLESRTRTGIVACLPNARVRSRSNIIEIENMAVIDYEDDELTRVDYEFEWDPAVFKGTATEMWLIDRADQDASIHFDEAFSLVGASSYAFGHWVWEFLPKYLEAELSGVMPKVPIIIDGGMPVTHRQALELILSPEVPIYELSPFAMARVGNLWCASTVIFSAALERMDERFKWDYLATPPKRFAPLIREMKRRLPRVVGTPDASDRIFFARKDNLHRQLVNQQVIRAAAEARGFCIVYPEEHDFAEQIKIVQSARFIVGPDGSAMYLTFFAEPGTKLCILIPPFVLHTQGEQAAVLEELGIDLTLISGKCIAEDSVYPHFSSYEVDELVFQEFLNQWV